MTVDLATGFEPPLSPAVETQPGQESRTRSFLRRLFSDPLSIFAVIGLGVIILAVVIGPLLWDRDPLAQDLVARGAAPSMEHPLGTDTLGRDVLSRLLHGGRISLALAFGAVLFSTVVAGAIGLISGFVRGVVDNVMMRIMDVMMSIPYLLFAIMIAVTLGPGLRNTLLAITIPAIPRDARIIRSVVLSVRERDFVIAAQACGVRPSRVMLRHVLPNSISVILVNAAVSVGFVLLEVAGLGYLGLGAQPPTPEWGAMLTDARSYIISRPLVVLVPGLAIFFSAVTANLLGDALRDAFDPSR
jgi:peptide/nickel transport system permease protein